MQHSNLHYTGPDVLCACVQEAAVKQEKAEWEARLKELEASLQKQRQSNSDLIVSSRYFVSLFLYHDRSLSPPCTQTKMEGLRKQHTKDLAALEKKHASELEVEVARIQKEREAQEISFRAAHKKV